MNLECPIEALITPDVLDVTQATTALAAALDKLIAERIPLRDPVTSRVALYSHLREHILEALAEQVSAALTHHLNDRHGIGVDDIVGSVLARLLNGAAEEPRRHPFMDN